MKRAVSLPSSVDQLVAHNLDHLLGRRERRKHFGSHSLDPNVLDQVAGNVQVHVGFQQCNANLAQRFMDVLFGQRALAAQVLEGALQFVCKVLKHRSTSSVADARMLARAASASSMRTLADSAVRLDKSKKSVLPWRR